MSRILLDWINRCCYSRERADSKERCVVAVQRHITQRDLRLSVLGPGSRRGWAPLLRRLQRFSRRKASWSELVGTEPMAVYPTQGGYAAGQAGQTFEGSFSAESTLIFATKYSFFSIFRDLQDSWIIDNHCPARILWKFGGFSRFLQTLFETC